MLDYSSATLSICVSDHYLLICVVQTQVKLKMVEILDVAEPDMAWIIG